MVYKEWQRARQIYLPILLTYVLTGIVVSTLLGPSMTFTNDSIFHKWVIGVLFVTLIAAIVTGAETIAEETNKNTLSFVLTRPHSREYIYTVKFILNALILAAILGITSLIMFFIEQLPQGYNFGVSTVDSGTPKTLLTYVSLEKLSASEALINITSICGAGMVVFALSILVSIYARSTIGAIGTVILMLFVPLVLASLLFQQVVYDTYIFYLRLGILGGPILLCVAAMLFLIGLKLFKAKEF